MAKLLLRGATPSTLPSQASCNYEQLLSILDLVLPTIFPLLHALTWRITFCSFTERNVMIITLLNFAVALIFKICYG